MKPEEILALRKVFDMDGGTFAKLMNVDARTIARWESGVAGPTGSAESVMRALEEVLRLSPHREEIIRFVRDATAVGGLSYLLLKLFERVLKPVDERAVWKQACARSEQLRPQLEQAAVTLGLEGKLNEDALEQRKHGYVAGYQDGYKEGFSDAKK